MFTFREQKTSTGINLTASEGASAAKKAKLEESQTIMVEKVNDVVSTLYPSSLCLTFVSSGKFLEFNSIKDTLDASWVKDQKPKFLKRISGVFFIFQGNVTL